MARGTRPLFDLLINAAYRTGFTVKVRRGDTNTPNAAPGTRDTLKMILEEEELFNDEAL